MAEFLALDWDHRHLAGFDAQVTKDKVRIRKAFSLDWPKDENLAADSNASGQQRGKWLAGQLQDLGISTNRVLICLPRETAVVRQLEVPDIPDNELPDIVRLQAETSMSSSLDRQLLDYLPLPKQPLATTREVLTTTVAVETINSIRKTLETAGLEVVSVGISSVAMTELVARVEKKQSTGSAGASLVLARHNRRLEISLIRQGNLLFTHSAELAGESEAQDVQLALAEVSRSFVALERALGGESMARAWVVGEQNRNAPLCEALRSRLSCPVNSLEPVTDLAIPVDDTGISGNEAHFAGPIGMLISLGDATTNAIDFLNPRKAVKRMDRQTVRMGVIAGVAALVLLSAGITLLMWNSSLANKLSEISQEESELAALNRAGKPTRDSAAKIDEWNRHNLHWPEQTRLLKQALPKTDRIFLTEFQTFPSRKKGELARLTTIGYAIDRADVADLKQKLSDMNYKVKPTAVTENQKDPKYRYRFELDLVLLPPKPTPRKKTTKK